MTDEFDIEHISNEEGQYIIDWAIGTGANLFMMYQMLTHEYDSDEERLADIKQGVEFAIENMPPSMVRAATIIANNAISESIAEEEAVEEFRNELKDL